MNRREALGLGLSSLVMSAAVSATAQTKVDARVAPHMKMTTDIPPSITTSDEVQTRIGALKFFDGFPDKATVDKVYDNLDFQRGIQAYLAALPAVSIRVLAEALPDSAQLTRRLSSLSNCWIPDHCS